MVGLYGTVCLPSGISGPEAAGSAGEEGAKREEERSEEGGGEGRNLVDMLRIHVSP